MWNPWSCHSCWCYLTLTIHNITGYSKQWWKRFCLCAIFNLTVFVFGKVINRMTCCLATVTGLSLQNKILHDSYMRPLALHFTSMFFQRVYVASSQNCLNWLNVKCGHHLHLYSWVIVSNSGQKTWYCLSEVDHWPLNLKYHIKLCPTFFMLDFYRLQMQRESQFR